MAKCEVKMPEEYISRLAKLGDQTDVIIPQALEAGGEVVLAQVKRFLQAVIGRNTKVGSRSSGELIGALGLTPARVDRGGVHNVKVGFAEPRGDGDSNAKIANILEYGKHGQPPKPFLKPAKSATKAACVEALKAKLDEVIGGL